MVAMPRLLSRAAFAALLLSPGAAYAQAPAAPPAPSPSRPGQTLPASPKPSAPARTAPSATPSATPVRPQVKPAPRVPVRPAPTVQPRPGPNGQRPATRPNAQRPNAARPVPVPVPVPAPTPAPEAEKPTEPGKGSATGQPLPRFVTLRTDEVNLRTGPGTRYPIEWVYKRRDLPVQIEREFEVWRLIRDPEGVKGWVHQATLAPRRSAVVVGGEHALRHDPKDDSAPVARLKPGVILRLRACEAASDWCQASVQDYRGWIKRSDIWGTLPGEEVK
jgi:SH3-like domain-containing protein